MSNSSQPSRYKINIKIFSIPLPTNFPMEPPGKKSMFFTLINKND